MAAILDLVFDGKVTVNQLTEWLSNDDQEVTHSPLLKDLSRIKPEFVPYFLNFLRDQSAAILQGCRSANATPSKTPTVLKTQRSITFEEPKRKTSTPRNQGPGETKRVQLFAASPLEGDSFTREPSHNNSSLNSPSGNASGNIYGSPVPSSWSLNNSGNNNPYSPTGAQDSHAYPSPKSSVPISPLSGGNYRKGGNRHGRTTPNNDYHRTQHKNCLGDFLVSSSRKKKSPSSAKRDEHSSHGGKTSWAKNKGDKKQWQLMSPSEVSGGRVFTLANSEEFPSLGEKRSGPEDIPSPSQSQNAASSAKIKTPLRRIMPTAVISEQDSKPSPQTPPTVLTTPSKPTSRRITPTALSDSSPRVFRFASDTKMKGEKSEVFAVPANGETVSMEEERKLLRQARASLVLPSVEETTPQKTSRLREMLARQITPTKIIMERMAAVTEATPELSEVTFRDRIYTLAEIYAFCIKEHLVPNVTVELYFVIQLLTTRGLDAELASEYLNQYDDDDVCYFASVHNSVYFAVLVLEKQQRILSLLDKGTLRLFVDNQRIANFLPSFKSDLSMMLARTNAKVRALPPSSPILGVSFQAETDNRKNFPNDRAFHTFKKQRDQFYELIREWHDNHMDAGWSVRDVQSDRIRSLVASGLDLSNHIHFARLFQSQLILMCKGDRNLNVEEDGESVSLLSELKLSNPDKFKRLQERFTTPLSVGSPCPQPYFPGCQEFFRDFIVVASSHLFNHHLTHTMSAKILDLNGTQFVQHESGADQENEIDPEELEALSTCLQTLRLLGKFLGFVTFLPYQSPEKLPDMMEAAVISMRNKVPVPVNLLDVIKEGQVRGSLVTTIPWVVEFLSMMDPVAPRVDTFSMVLSLLVEVYRSVCIQFFRERQSLTLLLVITCLGWLFELPIFPEGLFFKAFPFHRRRAILASNTSLDCMDLVDHSLFYTCCPYIGELKSLLMGFAVGSSNKGSTIRKITPLLTDSELPGTVSEKQIQFQLEESFFHNHPASMKRTVEFVADRVSSNYIKKFRAGYLPKLVHEGVTSVKDIKAEVATNGLDIRTKRRARQHLEDLGLELATKAHVISSEEISSYGSVKSGAILALTLPEDTSERVLNIATEIAARQTRDKVITWMHTHITKAMFIRELSPDLEKFLKMLGSEAGTSDVTHHLQQTPTRHHPWTISTTNAEKSMADTVGHDRHDEDGDFPSQMLVDIKGLLRDLVIGECTLTDEEINKKLQKINWVFDNRQDVIPAVLKCVLRMSMDLTYTLVMQSPGRWSVSIEDTMIEIWIRHRTSFPGFNHIFSGKHINMIDSSVDDQLAWEKLTGLLHKLIQNDLLSPSDLENQALEVTQARLPQRLLQHLSKAMSQLASCYHTAQCYQDKRKGHEFEEILVRLKTILSDSSQPLDLALDRIRSNKNERDLKPVPEESDNAPDGGDDDETKCNCESTDCESIPLVRPESEIGNNNTCGTNTSSEPHGKHGAKCVPCRLEKIKLHEASQEEKQIAPGVPSVEEQTRVCDTNSKDINKIPLPCDSEPSIDCSVQSCRESPKNIDCYKNISESTIIIESSSAIS